LYGAAFRALGLAKGQRVHLIMPSFQLENPLFAFGIWANGAVFSYAHPDLPVQELKDQALELKPDFILAHLDYVQLAVQIMEGLTSCKLLTLGPTSENATDFSTICAKVHPLESFVELAKDGSDIAQIQMTSGTTGKPKAVELSHFNAKNWNGPFSIEYREEQDAFVLMGLRLAPVSTLIVVDHLLLTNCTTIFGDFKHADNIVTTLIERKPAVLFLTVEQSLNFWAHPKLADLVQTCNLDFVKYTKKEFLYQANQFLCRHVLSVCGILPPISLAKMCQTFPNLQTMGNPFGSTETGIFTAPNAIDCIGSLVASSVVKVIQLKLHQLHPWFVQVVDPEHGQKLGPNKLGLLCVKSQTCMLGYLGNPKKTKEFFDEEGFAKMPDLVEFGQNGKIFHSCRLSDAIKYHKGLEVFHKLFYSRTENGFIPPPKLEEILLNHKNVADCCVFKDLHGKISSAVVLKTDSKVIPTVFNIDF